MGLGDSVIYSSPPLQKTCEDFSRIRFGFVFHSWAEIGLKAVPGWLFYSGDKHLDRF